MSQRFGRYELLRPLGRGGMAEVFLARYVGPEGFEKRLVIKRILPRLADDQRLLRMFFEEARTHVSLSHGNLVSVFDFGRVENDYFIAMEHVRGADLDLLLSACRTDKAPLPPSLVAYVGMELCRGLAYVHRQGFVHRDVSPRNVLLSSDGEVKLSDFGLVLNAARDEGVGVRGTLAYASPEQARGERVDGRGDLYSLGCVLAEAVLGARVREARDDGEALELARRGAAVVIDRPLGAVIARATQPAPADRFAGADEMLIALEKEALALGVGREASMRALAARITRLAPPSDPEPPARAVDATAATDVAATAPARRRPPAAGETYYRGNESVAVVDEILAPAPRARRRVAWLAAAAGVVAVALAGGLGLRARTARHAAGEAVAVPASAPATTQARSSASAATTAPASAPATTQARPSAPATTIAPSRTPATTTAPSSTAQPQPVPPSAPPTSPSPGLAPSATAKKPARKRPAPSPIASPASTGTVRIQCSPWCIPFVDGTQRGPDRKNHTLTLPAGRHVVEVRRLDDRLERPVRVDAGQTADVEFTFH